MKSPRFLYFLSALALSASCAVEKSENPLTPTLAGPIPGVEISAPKPLEPGANAQIPGNRQPLTLLLENSESNGPRPLSYLFEVASDPGFSNQVFAQNNISPGDGGRTSLTLPVTIPMGRMYYWRAKAQDGANEGPYSNAVNFNLFTPLAFEKPVPRAPVNNEKISTLRPDFKFSNAPFVGTPISVGYVIEIGTTDSFANKIAAWQINEMPSGITSFSSAQDLPISSQLFWHVRAFEGGVLGPWSDTHVFRTPTPAAPAPSPGPAPGGACSSQPQPINIVECRRAQFGSHMSSDQLVAFEKAVASDLNKSSIGGGPYGVLRKTSGANCGGYSCDIVCAGQGSSQRQYDVLGDSDGAQTPAWIGPKTYPNIRVDTCEIQ